MLDVFSEVKAYIGYVKILKKRHNDVGWTFCAAIKVGSETLAIYPDVFCGGHFLRRRRTVRGPTRHVTAHTRTIAL